MTRSTSSGPIASLPDGGWRRSRRMPDRLADRRGGTTTAAGAGSVDARPDGVIEASTPRPLGSRLSWIVPLGLAVAAAILRLLSLPTRGRFDADQGDQLLVVMRMVRDGDVPLLGPTTFLPGFHHGALYYWLLAPTAAVSDSDPTIITLTFVAFGIVAVLATWWLAGAIGGPTAGLVAGVLAVVSSSAVFASVTIWNPHLVPAAAALALCGAWVAHDRGRAAGWVLAGGAASVAIQCHVLAVVLVPPIVGLFLFDLLRASSGARRRLLLTGLAGGALILIGFLPLLIHELTTDFSELRALVAYILGSGTGEAVAETGPGWIARLPIVFWRTIAFPLVGTFTDAPIASILVLVLVVAIAIWRLRAGTPRERGGVMFLGATFIVGWLMLTVGVPSLATVVRDLPVDHYHAALDPIVIVIASLGIAAALDRGLHPASVATDPAPDGSLPGSAPSVSSPSSASASRPSRRSARPTVAGRLRTAPELGSSRTPTAEPIAFDSLPVFKTAGAYAFSVERRRAEVVEPARLVGVDSSRSCATTCSGKPSAPTAVGRPRTPPQRRRCRAELTRSSSSGSIPRPADICRCIG